MNQVVILRGLDSDSFYYLPQTNSEILSQCPPLIRILLEEALGGRCLLGLS